MRPEPEPLENPPPCSQTITGRLRPSFKPGCEDVQHETVFALLSGRSGGSRAGVVAALRRGRTECERIARTGPRDRLDGRHEAILSAGGSAVRNALEHLDAVDHHAANFSGRRVPDRGFEILGVHKPFPRRKLRTREKKGRLLREKRAG